MPDAPVVEPGAEWDRRQRGRVACPPSGDMGCLKLAMTRARLTLNFRLSRPGERFLIYGLAGWAIDSLFVCIRTGRRRPSSLLNVPVYGLAQPLFEPVHDRIRRRPLPQRAAMYGAGILAVEYASGWLLRRLVGYVPWDYSRARFAINGLVRLDYLPAWAAYGLGLERLHDLLVGPPCVETGGLPAGAAASPNQPPGETREDSQTR